MGCQNSLQMAQIPSKKNSFSLNLLLPPARNNPESQNSINFTKNSEQSIIEESIRLYQQLIQEDPFIDFPFDGLGCVEDQVGYYQGKVAQWYRTNREKGLIQGNPYDALSLCYSLKQEVLQGEKWYLSMLEKYPSISQLYFGLGNLYYKTKKFDKAQVYYRKSLEYNPRLHKTYQNIAAIYCYHKHDNKQAEEWATFALKLNKNNQHAKVILTLANDDNSIRYSSLIRFHNMHPKYARIHNSIANACLEAGEITEAIHWFTQATLLNPSYFAPYCGLAIIYNIQKRHQQAIQMCEAALAINPQHYQPYASLAEAYYAQGNLPAAQKNYEKCIQLNAEFQLQCDPVLRIQLQKQTLIQSSLMNSELFGSKNQQLNQDINLVVEIGCFGAKVERNNTIESQIRDQSMNL